MNQNQNQSQNQSHETETRATILRSTDLSVAETEAEAEDLQPGEEMALDDLIQQIMERHSCTERVALLSIMRVIAITDDQPTSRNK